MGIILYFVGGLKQILVADLRFGCFCCFLFRVLKGLVVMCSVLFLWAVLLASNTFLNHIVRVK